MDQEREMEIAQEMVTKLEEIMTLGTGSKDFVSLHIAAVCSMLLALIHAGDFDELRELIIYCKEVLVKKRELLTETEKDGKKHPIFVHPGSDKIQ